jgi:hypothetical protein
MMNLESSLKVWGNLVLKIAKNEEKRTLRKKGLGNGTGFQLVSAPSIVVASVQ